MTSSIPKSGIRWMAIASFVTMVACGGEKEITGPFTGAGGRVTFVPTPGATLRGSTLRKEELNTPSDNRAIPGSGFWFDPGEVRMPESMPWENRAGTLVVSYTGLTLPPGTVETSLRVAVWTGDRWLVLPSSMVDLGAKTVEAGVLAERGPGWYALIGSRGMYVSVEEDPMGNFAGDSIFVTVTHTSDVEIASVTASVLDRSTTVVPESRFSTYSRVGWISLVGMPRGNYVLRATATRTDGMALTDTMVFTKNLQPVVTLAEPAANATVGQRIRVRATCTDDDPGGCKSLRVLAYREGASQSTVIATSTDAIDQEVGLGGLTGRVGLTVEGTDQAGQRVLHSVTVTAQ